MNPLLNPTHPRPLKPNMEKVRKLVKSDTSSDSVSRSAMPTSWMYDDLATARMWQELEAQEVTSRLDAVESSPLKLIGDCAARIRKAIQDYELKDQDLLMSLIELMSENPHFTSLDYQDMLFEARQSLYSMILEHTDKTAEQALVLDTLRQWFEELQLARSTKL
jgi:hypothetical protein